MKRLLGVIVITLLLCGCGLVTMTASGIEASGHKSSLQKLETGMSMPQVKGVMGEPNKTEAFTSTKGEKVLVWFYLTEGRAPFRSLDDHNYMPIVFENGVLTGWGYAHLDKTKAK